MFQQYRKNIIANFIKDKILRLHFYFATSDLKKILKCFNNIIQTQKLIVMNEIRISSEK